MPHWVRTWIRNILTKFFPISGDGRFDYRRDHELWNVQHARPGRPPPGQTHPTLHTHLLLLQDSQEEHHPRDGGGRLGRPNWRNWVRGEVLRVERVEKKKSAPTGASFATDWSGPVCRWPASAPGAGKNLRPGCRQVRLELAEEAILGHFLEVALDKSPKTENRIRNFPDSWSQFILSTLFPEINWTRRYTPTVTEYTSD